MRTGNEMCLRLARVAVVVLSCACAPPSEREPDAGAAECSPYLPEPSDPCLAGQCGNALGVGQPCTDGGNECSDLGLGNAILCTADFSDSELWFCTMGCDVDEDCGADAVCTGDPADPLSPKGCTPSSCAD